MRLAQRIIRRRVHRSSYIFFWLCCVDSKVVVLVQLRRNPPHCTCDLLDCFVIAICPSGVNAANLRTVVHKVIVKASSGIVIMTPVARISEQPGYGVRLFSFKCTVWIRLYLHSSPGHHLSFDCLSAQGRRPYDTSNEHEQAHKVFR